MGDCPTKISFDEWNIWHAWRRPSCVIDGMFTAGMLHMLMSEAKQTQLGVACQFELVNESGIKATPNEAYLSATGQAFTIMKPHQEGTILAASDELVATVKDGVVTVTAINFSCDQVRRLDVQCGEALMESTLYEGRSLQIHTCFEVSELAVEVKEGRAIFEIPAHSVARIQYKV